MTEREIDLCLNCKCFSCDRCCNCSCKIKYYCSAGKCPRFCDLIACRDCEYKKKGCAYLDATGELCY